MTMRVTILTTVMGESGSLLTAGSTYTVNNEFGAALVGGKRATDTDGVLTPPQTEMKPYLATDPITGNVTGLVGPGNRRFLPQPAPPSLRPVIGICGDSIGALSVLNPAYGNGWSTRSAVTWAQAMLGQPWVFPTSNMFAVSGSLLKSATASVSVIDTQLPLIIASNKNRQIQRMFISIGTNDINAGNTYTTIITNYAVLIQSLTAIGIIPVCMSILPRGSTSGFLAANQLAQRINLWLQKQADVYGLIEYIDLQLDVLDSTTAYGNILTSASADTLHPNIRSAYSMGLTINNYYRAKSIYRTPRYATSTADIYVAVTNTSGVISDTPNPYMTGGTTAPTGMTSGGGGWAVGTRTLQNTATKPVVNLTVSASTQHSLYQSAAAAAGWLVSDKIQEGDYLYGIMEIELQNCVNVLPSMYLRDRNGVTSVDANWSSMNEAVDFTVPGGVITSSASQTLHLETPPSLVRAYGGSSNAAALLYFNMTGATGASGSAVVKAFEMRKVVDGVYL